nr:hypothetical protein [Bacteroidota bacterium]
MKRIKLEKADIEGLDVVSCSYNLRKDLVTFVDFCFNNYPKRSHRNNDISKTDLRKIAKAFGNKDVINNIKEYGESDYIDFIDSVVYKLGLVVYDTKGEYVGYYSSEPSYPDNHINVNFKEFEKYLGLSPYKQDEKLLGAIIDKYDNVDNEFCTMKYHSRLDKFKGRGNYDIMHHIKFDVARRYMLDILSQLPAGEWYATQSLIKYLKQVFPLFLIPDKIKWDKWTTNKSRYAGIKEVRIEDTDRYNSGIQINENDADVFERVEGRWAERFLEYIPLILGFVDVAYDKDFSTEIYPVSNKLKAFKVNYRLENYHQKDYPVKATLQPNFDLIIEAPIYPASIARAFIDISDTITEEPHLVLRLNKKKIIKYHADNTEANIIGQLEEILSNPIPANVRIELSEWMEQTNKFVLYSRLDLYENSDTKDRLEAEHVINNKFSLIKDGLSLHENLMVSGKVPVLINHKDEKFTLAPKGSNTIFATKDKTVLKARTKERVNISSDTYIIYSIDNQEFYKELLLKCMEEKLLEFYDADRCTLKFHKKLEKRVGDIISKLKADYIVSIKNIQ